MSFELEPRLDKSCSSVTVNEVRVDRGLERLGSGLSVYFLGVCWASEFWASVFLGWASAFLDFEPSTLGPESRGWGEEQLCLLSWLGSSDGGSLKTCSPSHPYNFAMPQDLCAIANCNKKAKEDYDGCCSYTHWLEQSGQTDEVVNPKCKVPGCNDPYRSKGFCGRHYQQWRRGRLEGFPRN